MAKRHFSPAMFNFLNELEQNNEKEWWEENKERYIAVIREPALEFINDFASHLGKISNHFTADSRTIGGSLMRPYRDLRFSKDKTRYKTNVGIQFRHESGKDVHAPGFYLHIEPRACFAGVGLWHPETVVARQIRQSINDDPAGWRKAAKMKAFSDVWSTSQTDDEMLKRVPKGPRPRQPLRRRFANEELHRRHPNVTKRGDFRGVRSPACRNVPQGLQLHLIPLRGRRSAFLGRRERSGRGLHPALCLLYQVLGDLPRAVEDIAELLASHHDVDKADRRPCQSG